MLWEWGLSGARDSAELVVSELVTNAVATSSAIPGGPHPVTLRLLSDRHELVIMVADVSGAAPVRIAPAVDAEGGRGLLIVEAVAERWGFYRVAGGGKVVWAVCAATAGPMP